MAKVNWLTSEADHLPRLAEKKAVECEKKASLKIMAKLNAFRQSAKTKREEAKAAEAELQCLKDQLKWR